MKRTFACRFINEHRENFTENALAAIAAAENLCAFLGSETVNTGHLLWGLARLGSGTASGIMDDYGIKRERVSRAGRSDRDFLSHHSGYSSMPSISLSGKDMPQSTTSTSPPHSHRVMFLPSS